MNDIIRKNINKLKGTTVNNHKEYEYCKKNFVPRDNNKQCLVNIYEVPPHKSAYPYHFHTSNEEVFYIISGEGVLRTPEGESSVCAGDIIYFPANEKGAHKLTNSSDSEMLKYIDFGTKNDLDVCFYPDSNKIGVWGKDVNKLFKLEDEVDYYSGE